jgi:hypothetical protein
MSTLEKGFAEVLTFLVGTGVWLLIGHLTGGACYTFGLPVGGARGELRRATRSFVADLERKTLPRDAVCQTPADQAALDPPRALRRVFRVAPETVKIAGHKIRSVQVEPGKTRGRVEARLSYRDLARKQGGKQDLTLHFERVTAEAPWCLKLEESLRSAEGTPGTRG